MIRMALFSALVFALVSGVALAGGDTKTATGTVESVMTDSLTLKDNDQKWDFVVNESTVVVAAGAGTLTKEAETMGRKTMITDFLSKGQQVTVEYHEMGGKLHATKVEFPKVRVTK
jgi:hypothetical protein